MQVTKETTNRPHMGLLDLFMARSATKKIARAHWNGPHNLVVVSHEAQGVFILT